MKITINRNELLAAMLFASQDDERHILNGVKIECREDFRPVLIATDGKRLVAIESTADVDNLPTETGEIILSTDFIKPICQMSKARGGKLFPWIAIEFKACSDRVDVELMGCGLVVHAENRAVVEGTYPNWRSIIPSKLAEFTPQSDVGVNAEYVGDFAKASKLLTDQPPTIVMGFTKDGGVIQVRITGAPNFYGAIMPTRREENSDLQPEFLNL